MEKDETIISFIGSCKLASPLGQFLEQLVVKDSYWQIGTRFDDHDIPEWYET